MKTSTASVQSMLSDATNRDRNNEIYQFQPDADLPSIPYSTDKAIAYAKQWSRQADNTCGFCMVRTPEEDCAHFVAHCLAAGGIEITSSRPVKKGCPAGLTHRNIDLHAHLSRLASAYDNVRIVDLSDALPGDIGLLQVQRDCHAFMISKPWNIFSNPFGTPRIYSHSGARGNGTLPADFRQHLSSAFRIDPI